MDRNRNHTTGGALLSLAIEIDQVRAVLLDAGWHTVYWKDGVSTFDLDSYEYLHGENEVRMGGGDYESCGIPALGFAFLSCSVQGAGLAKDEPGDWIYGPITSIKAVMGRFE